MPCHIFHLEARNLNALFTLLLVTLFSTPTLALEPPAADPGEAEAFAALLEDLSGFRLDPNHASLEDLETLPWLSRETAESLLAFRKQSGGFSHIADLLRVPDISPETLDAIRPYLSLTPRRPVSARTR